MKNPQPNRAASPKLRRAALAAASTLLLAAPALAASEGGDPMKEMFYQAINLVLVLGLIGYFARKPVTAFFAERREQISSDLDSAAELLSEAETRNRELQRRLVDLQSEIEEIRETTRRRAEEESERILAEANKAAERIQNDAAAAVGQELQRAQAALRAEAANLALEVAGEILREQVGEGDRERLVDEFITRVEPGQDTTGH
jgi:F-type H+-transporting ATPase subunit b